jgi:hypothetical protein
VAQSSFAYTSLRASLPSLVPAASWADGTDLPGPGPPTKPAGNSLPAGGVAQRNVGRGMGLDAAAPARPPETGEDKPLGRAGGHSPRSGLAGVHPSRLLPLRPGAQDRG